MPHDIFISYSNKDKSIADGICANLEAAGIRCWIAPRDIAPGEDWPSAIAQAISQSRVMVLIFSAHSNKSDEVSRELFLAAHHKVIIIPFKIEDVQPEAGKQYYLGRTHWLDAMNPPTQEQIRTLVLRAKSCLTVEAGRDTDPAAPVTGPLEMPSRLPSAAPRSRSWAPYSLIPVALIVLLAAWLGLSRIKSPALPYPTASATPTASETPISLPSATQTAPAAPTTLALSTPVAPPPTLTPPPGGILFADDFSNPSNDGAFDKSQWTFAPYYGFQTTIKQENGALLFTRSSTVNNEDGQLTTKASWSFGDFTYIEARLKISSQHTGNDGNLNLAVGLAPNLPSIWYTTCGIQLNNPQPYLWCIQVSTEKTPYDYNRSFQLLEYDRWYTLRIQMDPQTVELSYYLDGQLLDRFQPTNVDWLMKQKFTLTTGISAGQGTGMTAYVDDVKIGR